MGMARPPPGPLLLGAAFAALLPAAAAWAAGRVECRAERAGDRALVQVTVLELFDRELLRLVELGLEGRLSVEATLYRRRRFWFDPRMAEHSTGFTIAWSKADASFTFDGRLLPHPMQVPLPLFSLRPDGDSLRDGDFYLDIAVRLQVITANSLGQVARWLVASPTESAGETSAQEAASPPALLPRALVGYLAADLARTANGRCAVTP